jgi:lipopolysaccharide transport system ATP-binding protein
MIQPMIDVHHLGKSYRLGEQQPYLALRDALGQIFRRPRPNPPPFWALQGVDFSVRQGEVLGIIGRNGAGKSTLLKILSRITPPTKGQITLRGRVASLLEVGTGFHPELTGRENVFLNGAILGMSQREIRERFDAIVAFAEIDDFLDTPVKRYSSGMYVRLAFAVAAHLEPEILLVDEVLAVGDVAFQKKCLGKMTDVARGGRTILFVSHNMAAMRNLSDRCLYLKGGRVALDASTDHVINTYLEDSAAIAEATSLVDRVDRQGTGQARFVSFSLSRADAPSQVLVSGEPASIHLSYASPDKEPLRTVNVGVGIDNQSGERIFALSTEYTGQTFSKLPPKGSIQIALPKLPLVPGRYTATLYMSIGNETADWVMQAATFIVEAGDFFTSGRLPEGQGSFLVDHSFEKDA